MISELKRIFRVGTYENGTFKVLGIGVKRTKVGITIDQNLYNSSISQIDRKKGRSLRENDELSQKEKDLKIVEGQMMQAASQTWPDVLFDVYRISNTEKSLKVKLLFKVNKSLLKLKLLC